MIDFNSSLLLTCPFFLLEYSFHSLLNLFFYFYMSAIEVKHDSRKRDGEQPFTLSLVNFVVVTVVVG